LGWIKPYVVTGAASLTLRPSETTGEAILLPTSTSSTAWNGSAFDEYILMEYYTPTSLNEKDSTAAYPDNKAQGFQQPGVRIYHVDARLAKVSGSTFVSYADKPISMSSTYTRMAHSNSSAANVTGTNVGFRLIQEMDCTQKRNFDTDPLVLRNTLTGKTVLTGAIADDASLFHKDNSFSFSSYSHSFPKTTMNDGGSFPFNVSFGTQNADGAEITITLA
jgi:hypothetical protein